VGTRVEDVVELADQLPEVTRHERDRWWRLDVRGTAFGYVWPATQTAGLKQTLADQLGLVAERPDVFEVQYTSGGFGWVVVHLEAVGRDELAELVLDAWRLSAPADLVAARGDELPV
jgi:hypothetical protein